MTWETDEPASHDHEWTIHHNVDGGYIRADCHRCGASMTYADKLIDLQNGIIYAGISLDCNDELVRGVLLR